MGKKYLLAVTACAFMFTACGDDVTEVNEIHQDGMAVLEAGLELSKQKCDKTNVGEMLFVTDSAMVFMCDGESWQTLKGEKGSDGKDGEKGVSGINGEDGSSCSARPVTNAAGLNGIEVTCGKTVVDTIWNGEKGENGEAGKSAYEIAKENGFEGTEAEWLESMKGPFIQDKRDGKIYKTVKIGNQVWMAENLNYSVNPGKQSWCYNDSAEYCEKYGRLYTWAAAIDSVALANDKDNPQTCGYRINCTLPTVVQGVCPEGWHLPDTTEWRKLFDAVGGKDVAGKMLKSANGWNDYEGSSGNGLDAYGFSALPVGYRRDDGYFDYAGSRAYFWSASQNEYYSNYAYSMYLYYYYENANLSYYGKDLAFSVRCLRDDDSL